MKAVGRCTKRERLADQLRRKRAQTASGLALGAKKPLKGWPSGVGRETAVSGHRCQRGRGGQMTGELITIATFTAIFVVEVAWIMRE